MARFCNFWLKKFLQKNYTFRPSWDQSCKTCIYVSSCGQRQLTIGGEGSLYGWSAVSFHIGILHVRFPIGISHLYDKSKNFYDQSNNLYDQGNNLDDKENNLDDQSHNLYNKSLRSKQQSLCSRKKRSRESLLGR